ncbi:hypothetical protein Dimus_037679 [Dionaea muscipula]
MKMTACWRAVAARRCGAANDGVGARGRCLGGLHIIFDDRTAAHEPGRRFFVAGFAISRHHHVIADRRRPTGLGLPPTEPISDVEDVFGSGEFGSSEDGEPSEAYARRRSGEDHYDVEEGGGFHAPIGV